jgi:hypothetical protein
VIILALKETIIVAITQRRLLKLLGRLAMTTVTLLEVLFVYLLGMTTGAWVNGIANRQLGVR